MDELTGPEKQLLAEWYESSKYKVFKKVLTLRGNTHASSALQSQDMRTLRELQGRAAEDKALHNFFRAVHKEATTKKS